MADDTNKIEPMVRLGLIADDWEWLLGHAAHLQYTANPRIDYGDGDDDDSDRQRMGFLLGLLRAKLRRHKAASLSEPRPTFQEVFNKVYDAGGHVWDKPADPRKFLNE